MNNEESEFNIFMQKLIIKSEELFQDYYNLSENNKQKFKNIIRCSLGISLENLEKFLSQYEK